MQQAGMSKRSATQEAALSRSCNAQRERITIASLIEGEEERLHNHSNDFHDFLRTVNLKVMFHRTVGSFEYPSMEQLHHYLIEEMFFSAWKVNNAVVLILDQYEGEVDDNMFACILLYLLSDNLHDSGVALLQTIALPSCSECGERKSTESYVSHERKYLYQRCSNCRSSCIARNTDLSILYTKLDYCEDGEVFTKAKWHKLTWEASKELRIGFSCLHLLGCRFLLRLGDDVLSAARAYMEPLDGYKYVLNRTSNGAAYFYCSQYRHHKPSSRVNNANNFKLKCRHSETKRIEKCEGFMSISKPKRDIVVIRCSHKSNHESCRIGLETTQDDVNRIQFLSEQGLAPFQICSVMQSEGRKILWNQVH